MGDMNISRMATSEYIGTKRRAYANAKAEKRRLLLDEVCETTGYSRKYANRLLTGNRKFRERKGRRPTYTERDKAVLEQLRGLSPVVLRCRFPDLSAVHVL